MAINQILTKQSGENEIRSYFNAILELSKSDNEFPVNLDEVWMLVYPRKDHAVRALKENFIEGVDYQSFPKNGERSINGQFSGGGTDYHLTVSCMEFFIARKVRPVFEVYRQVFHKAANSIHPSEPLRSALTNTFDISTLTGRPHARIMKDIGRILEQGAGADDFIFRYRPVQTDSGTKEYETYDITPKGLLTLATGYPPLLRDRIAASLMEILPGGNGKTGIRPAPQPFCGNRTGKAKAPEAEMKKRETGPDCLKGQTDVQEEINALKERIRRMEKQFRRIARFPDTPNEDIFRQYPQYHSISVPMPTPDDLYNSMTFDNVRRKLYCDLGIEFSPVSLSEYLEAHGFVTNEGKERLKPTKKAIDDNWILHPVEIPDEEDGIRLWRPKFTERGYMILVSRIRDFGVFDY